MGYKTIWEGYQATVKRIPDRPQLGTRNVVLEDGSRDYSWRSFREVYDMQNAFARGNQLDFFLCSIGLSHMNFCQEQNVDGVKYRFLGIIGKNREEWAIADLACMRSSVTIVPFFESLGADAIAFVLNQTELSTICCEKKSFATLLKLKKEGKINGIKALICFDKVEEDMAKSA
jgi:long-chain acyl-CoA synthetase